MDQLCHPLGAVGPDRGTGCFLTDIAKARFGKGLWGAPGKYKLDSPRFLPAQTSAFTDLLLRMALQAKKDKKMPEGRELQR